MPVHRRLTAAAAAVGVAALALPLVAAGPASAETDDYEVLVVGKTLGFRHSSIDEATSAIIALGEANGFTVDVWDPPVGWSPGQPERTLESTPFTSAADLEQYATVVFVSTVDGTNNLDPARPTLLDASELAAFQGYIRGGGGFAGVHAATDSMHTIPWYSELTGGSARFVGHPRQQVATQVVEDRTHPSTDHLDATWTRFDEWYNFNVSPRPDVRVLTNIDETTYDPGRSAMGTDHPLAWCHNFEGARSWYTAGGHTEASYTEPAFLEHLLGGIEWSAGAVDGGGDCVTWQEVDGLIADLVDDGSVDAHAAGQITKQLERARVLADDGANEQAAERLAAAAAQVRAHVKDEDANALLAEKVADLRTWQAAVG
ncbi:ThuA domain-containing protein [Aquipuribacter nitratireducens]|uniref:ThuA domain-containing protein n=1 Tax=Aquipuribacter nitratireducens TaxID=650104 RepID=A0ABW0GL22_9MICO